MGFLDKLKGNKEVNYARKFHDAVINEKPTLLEGIWVEWLNNGNQEDANFMYATVFLGMHNPDNDKNDLKGLFAKAHGTPAIDSDLKSFFRDLAQSAIDYYENKE